MCVQAEDVVFSDFCAEIRVDSIRQYEQQQSLSMQAELDNKRYDSNIHTVCLGTLLMVLSAESLKLQLHVLTALN